LRKLARIDRDSEKRQLRKVSPQSILVARRPFGNCTILNLSSVKTTEGASKHKRHLVEGRREYPG